VRSLLQLEQPIVNGQDEFAAAIPFGQLTLETALAVEDFYRNLLNLNKAVARPSAA